MDYIKATIKLDKKLFRKAGDALAYKNKKLKIRLIIGLIICFVIAPLLTYFCYLKQYDEIFVMPTLGIILIFSYYFYPKILGDTLYKAQSKEIPKKETTCYFSEDDFRVETVDTNSVIKYSAVVKLLETDDLYLIYITRTSAFIIPKNCIENSICDVKMFLESKVGKQFTFVKNKSTGKAVAKIIGIVILSLLLTFLAYGIADKQLDAPQTFYHENYSVTLDKHFAEWEENQMDDYSLASDEATLIVDKYNQEDAEYVFDDQNVNLEKIIDNFCEDVEMISTKQVNRNHYIIKYFDEYEGIKFYNTVCIQQVGDEYWITQLYCEKSLKEDYEQKFDTWISSIKYNGGQTK
ncbi:MAG: YcxB family protein [Clostridia bacterium]|nr:YcxB family protein [Clostridia bacterium]